MKKVYVIGDNMLSSMGMNSAAHWEQLAAAQSGIQKHDFKGQFEGQYYSSLVDPIAFDEATQKISQANHYTRLEKYFILSIQDAISQSALAVNTDKTIFIFSSTKGNIDLLSSNEAIPKERLRLGSMAQVISNYFDNPNTPIVISSACISGVAAILTGSRLLSAGIYDQAVISGGDLLTDFTLSGFHTLKAMSDAPCRPFDKNRKGITLGEGAATIVLSTKKASPIQVLGGSISNDANHISGPSRTGDGLSQAIQNALQISKKAAKDIGFLSAHGTATLYNDEMEAKAFHTAQLSEVPTNSYKGYWGHTLGAAGLLESVASLHSLQNNTLIQSLGFEEMGVSLALNIIRKKQAKSLQTVLKTASGFGGCNAAILFQKD